MRTCIKPVWNILIVNCINDRCIWNTGVTWQGVCYKLPEDDTSVETCRSVIICEIIVCIRWSGYIPNKNTGYKLASYSTGTDLGQTLTFWTRNYFFFLVLAHPVYKMRIIQETNMIELWNKLHFEEEKNGDYTPCLKYSVTIFVE